MLRPGTHCINHKGHAEWIDLRDTCTRQPFRVEDRDGKVKLADFAQLTCIDSLPLTQIRIDVPKSAGAKR